MELLPGFPDEIAKDILDKLSTIEQIRISRTSKTIHEYVHGKSDTTRLSERLKPNKQEGEETLLLFVVEYGDRILTKRYIQCRYTNNAFIRATKHGHEHILRYLFEMKCNCNNNCLLLDIDTINHALSRAARHGNTSIINFLIEKGADDWDEAALCAAEDGNDELVNLFTSKGAKCWNHIMARAARGGHLSIIDLCIENGADEWNGALKLASEGGHKDIIDFLIERGADCWDEAAGAAAKEGNDHLVEFFISKGIDDWNIVLFGAVLGDNDDIIDLCIDNGARDWNGALHSAAKGGHRHLVEMFIEFGAFCYESSGLHCAVSGKHLALAKFFIQRNRGSLDGILSSVGHLHNPGKILDYLIQEGANDFFRMMVSSTDCGNLQNLKFAIDKHIESGKPIDWANYIRNMECVIKWTTDLYDNPFTPILLSKTQRRFMYAIDRMNEMFKKDEQNKRRKLS